MTKRDANGRFLKGHAPLSPGRPSRPVEIEYMNILKQGVTADDFKKIVATAVSLAMAGDWKAREWLSNYLIGKPPQILELRGADALLLAKVLEQLKNSGVSASQVFEAMLNELAESDVKSLESGGNL